MRRKQRSGWVVALTMSADDIARTPCEAWPFDGARLLHLASRQEVGKRFVDVLGRRCGSRTGQVGRFAATGCSARRMPPIRSRRSEATPVLPPRVLHGPARPRAVAGARPRGASADDLRVADARGRTRASWRLRGVSGVTRCSLPRGDGGRRCEAQQELAARGPSCVTKNAPSSQVEPRWAHE